MAMLAMGHSSGCRSAAPNREELVVFAASSLREAFTDLAADFQAARPGAQVRFNWGGSQALRLQLEHGARADVIALADARMSQEVSAAGLSDTPVVFAENALAIAVPRNNPAGITGLGDLTKARRIALAAPQVPAGRYSREILQTLGRRRGEVLQQEIESRVVSQDFDVRQVLAKVELGEVDAGLVYRTDCAAAAEQIESVSIPPEENAVARYAAAAVKSAPNASLAHAWMRQLDSTQGRARLSARGFLLPERTR